MEEVLLTFPEWVRAEKPSPSMSFVRNANPGGFAEHDHSLINALGLESINKEHLRWLSKETGANLQPK